MTEELREHIESLLALADQATDPHNNGLFDREDLVRLVKNFGHVTRTLLDDQTRLEYDQDEMAWDLYGWQGNAPWGGRC